MSSSFHIVLGDDFFHVVDTLYEYEYANELICYMNMNMPMN